MHKGSGLWTLIVPVCRFRSCDLLEEYSQMLYINVPDAMENKHDPNIPVIQATLKLIYGYIAYIWPKGSKLS